MREKLFRSACIVRRKLSGSLVCFQDVVEISSIFSSILKNLFIPELIVTDASESRANCPNASDTQF